MMKYKLKLPDSKTSGFLRRKAEFIKHIGESEKSDEGFQEYIEYMAQYVEAEKPVEAILDLSRDEIAKIHAAILYGRDPDPEA